MSSPEDIEKAIGLWPHSLTLTLIALSTPAAIRPEGKNNRLFVFSISMASISRRSLDVAADTHEDLLDWVKKIREAAQTADARVRDAVSVDFVIYRCKSRGYF